MKRSVLLGAAFFAMFAAQAQIRFEDRRIEKQKLGRFEIIKTAVVTLDEDAKAIVNRPLKNPNLVANGVKLFALVTTDYQTTNLFQKHVEPLDVYTQQLVSFPSLFPRVPVVRSWTAGVDGYMYSGVTAMYLAGFALGNEKMQEAGVLTTKAIIESYVVSHLILKTVFARNRPMRPLGDVSELDRDSQYPFVSNPLDFFNFHPVYFNSNPYGTGFPSYHATMYFAFASTMARVYDNKWIPYSLATFALVHNIRGHNHWVSELVAGAVIGNFIGKVVYENYHEKRAAKLSKDSKGYSLNFGMGQAFGVAAPSITLSW